MKRRLVVVLLATLTSLGIVATMTSTAGASRRLGYDFCTLNGNNLCVGDSNLQVGDHLTEVTRANDRTVYITLIDQNCGSSGVVCWRVYLRFYNGDYIASTNNCDSDIVVKSPQATTGIVWHALETSPNANPTYAVFDNQACPDFDLSSDNQSGNNWQLRGDGLNGWYQKIDVYV